MIDLKQFIAGVGFFACYACSAAAVACAVWLAIEWVVRAVA